MNNKTIQEGKTLAIVCYLTFIGLIIAIIQNNEKKNIYTYFHVRQMLGLIIALLVSNTIEKYVNGTLGFGLWLIIAAAWFFGLASAIQGKTTPIPIIGEYFQKWFKNVK